MKALTPAPAGLIAIDTKAVPVIVSASADGVIKYLLGNATGNPTVIQTIKAHEGLVPSANILSLVNNSSYLATASHDGTAKLWSITPTGLVLINTFGTAGDAPKHATQFNSHKASTNNSLVAITSFNGTVIILTLEL